MYNVRNQEQEIATIKPRTIVIELSDADCERISDQAAHYGFTVANLLENFIGDLVDGTYTNGSDERMYANEYCDRCWFSWNGNLLSHLQDYSDVDDFLTAWDEKLYAEAHPSQYREERIELDESEKLWFEEIIDIALEDWNPVFNIDMDREIANCRQWLSEKKSLIMNK